MVGLVDQREAEVQRRVLVLLLEEWIHSVQLCCNACQARKGRGEKAV